MHANIDHRRSLLKVNTAIKRNASVAKVRPKPRQTELNQSGLKIGYSRCRWWGGEQGVVICNYYMAR